VLRMNRAVLAAFLCSATAPAATCDLTPQMSPLGASQWMTLEDAGVTTSLPDPTILLLERSTAGERSADEMRAVVNVLPVTSTAPNHEPESGLR
jgi:hypothetical protein